MGSIPNESCPDSPPSRRTQLCGKQGKRPSETGGHHGHLHPRPAPRVDHELQRRLDGHSRGVRSGVAAVRASAVPGGHESGGGRQPAGLYAWSVLGADAGHARATFRRSGVCQHSSVAPLPGDEPGRCGDEPAAPRFPRARARRHLVVACGPRSRGGCV